MDVVGTVRRLGGFASRRQLLARGASVDQLAAAVRWSDLRRPRRGWYSDRDPVDPEFRAVAVGGRLTGLSAIEALGGWVWNRPARIQVAVARDASRLRERRSRDVVDLRWEPRSTGGTASVVSVEDALVRAFLDADLESAIVAADWALHVGAIDSDAFARVLARLPAGIATFGSLADGRSESPLESVARLRLVLAGYRVVPQQRVGRRQRFDLLVDGVVALEVDGRIHETTFEEDRIKDLAITVDGWHCIRITSRMLRHHWPDVLRAIDAAAAARVGPARRAAIRPPDSGTARHRSPVSDAVRSEGRTTSGVA